MNVLEVKQLQIMRDQRVIIDNLSFELPEGHRLFLQGDIGCGKSTLLHCLLGFIPYQQGEIRWFDNTCRQEKDFVPLRGKIGILISKSIVEGCASTMNWLRVHYTLMRKIEKC